MFSVTQKGEIADKVQKILRDTNHPELPVGEIPFLLHVDGEEAYRIFIDVMKDMVANKGE